MLCLVKNPTNSTNEFFLYQSRRNHVEVFFFFFVHLQSLLRLHSPHLLSLNVALASLPCDSHVQYQTFC